MTPIGTNSLSWVKVETALPRHGVRVLTCVVYRTEDGSEAIRRAEPGAYHHNHKDWNLRGLFGDVWLEHLNKMVEVVAWCDFPAFEDDRLGGPQVMKEKVKDVAYEAHTMGRIFARKELGALGEGITKEEIRAVATMTDQKMGFEGAN